MFQEANPNTVGETVKNVFESHKTLSKLLQSVFQQLWQPTISSLSLSEFRAMVDNWEEKIKVVTQTVPLKGKG